ncbi:MAG: GAF domain-containing protein [Planctomycetes bacterium]|nr:GAF domain-containing protein [Planctomycetota bacterium]
MTTPSDFPIGGAPPAAPPPPPPPNPREASGFLANYALACDRLVGALARSPGTERFWDLLGEEVSRVLPCFRMSVLVADDGDRDLMLHRVYFNGRRVAASRVSVPVIGTSYGRVFLSGIPMVLDRFEERYREHAYLWKEGVRSGMVVPITLRTRIVGTLNVGADLEHAYGPEALDLALHLANLVALAVEHDFASSAAASPRRESAGSAGC